MNVPLQLLQGPPNRHSADLQLRKSDYAPAEHAQSTRKKSAEPPRKESFSDLLREASQTKFDAQNQAPAIKDDGSGAADSNDDADAAVIDGNQRNPETRTAHDSASHSSTADDAQISESGDSTANTGKPRGAQTEQNAAPRSNQINAGATTHVQGATTTSPAVESLPATSADTAFNSSSAPVAGPDRNINSTSPIVDHAPDSSPPNATTKQSTAVELKPILPLPGQPTYVDDAVESTTPSSSIDAKTSTAAASAVQTPSSVSSTSQQPVNAHSTPVSAPATDHRQPDVVATQPTTAEPVAEANKQQVRRASDQLRQQILRHVETADVHESYTNRPAERRAGDINSRLAQENASARGFASADTLTAQTQTPFAGPGQQPAIQIETFNAPRLGNLTPQSPLDQPVDEARFTSGVVRGLSALVNQRGGVMHMRLDPPDLGQLRIQMTITRGTVSAQFQAADAQAGALLEQNMGSLRTALERHGLSVERLAVQVHQPGPGNQSSGSNLNDQSSQQGDRNQNQQDAAGGQSRGRHDQPGDDRSERQRFMSNAQSRPFNFAQTLKTSPAQE